MYAILGNVPNEGAFCFAAETCSYSSRKARSDAGRSADRVDELMLVKQQNSRVGVRACVNVLGLERILIATLGRPILCVRQDELILVGRPHKRRLILNVDLQLLLVGLEFRELRGRGECGIGQSGGQALVMLLQGVLGIVQH